MKMELFLHSVCILLIAVSMDICYLFVHGKATNESQRNKDKAPVEQYKNREDIRVYLTRRPVLHGKQLEQHLEQDTAIQPNIISFNPADITDVLQAIESYLIEEESRIVENLVSFRHSLLVLGGFKQELHNKRAKRENVKDVGDLNLARDKLGNLYLTKRNGGLDFRDLFRRGMPIYEPEVQQLPVNDFRRKIAMKLVKDDTGQTSLDLKFDYESLGSSGRYRRDTSTTTALLPVFVLSGIFVAFGISGLIYLSIYLCKKHRVCTHCYDEEESPLNTFIASKGNLLNLPRFAVTNTDGHRRSFQHAVWTMPYSTVSRTARKRGTTHFLDLSRGTLEKSWSYPNLTLKNSEQSSKSRRVKYPVYPSPKPQELRQLQRSLSESDREQLLQEQTNPAARHTVRKAQRMYRSHQARLKRRQRLTTLFPSHHIGDSSRHIGDSSGDSGFSTPSSSMSMSRSISSRSWSRSISHGLYDTPVGRSTSSLGSTVSNISRTMSHHTIIPGQIE